MSGLDLLRDADLQTEREVAREPAKRWRNWWRAHVHTSTQCIHCGAWRQFNPGDTYAQHCRAHPSKDVAESVAASLWHPRRTYLGAYPEGERP